MLLKTIMSRADFRPSWFRVALIGRPPWVYSAASILLRSISFQRIVLMEIDDGFFLPLLQPEIAGNPTVVLVDPAIALSPVIELAGGYAQPINETPGADLSLL
jgi:hypothetical protein